MSESEPRPCSGAHFAASPDSVMLWGPRRNCKRVGAKESHAVFHCRNHAGIAHGRRDARPGLPPADHGPGCGPLPRRRHLRPAGSAQQVDGLRQGDRPRGLLPPQRDVPRNRRPAGLRARGFDGHGHRNVGSLPARRGGRHDQSAEAQLGGEVPQPRRLCRRGGNSLPRWRADNWPRGSRKCWGKRRKAEGGRRKTGGRSLAFSHPSAFFLSDSPSAPGRRCISARRPCAPCSGRSRGRSRFPPGGRCWAR